MKTSTTPSVSVLVPRHITAAQFGIDQVKFDTLVRGRELPISHTAGAKPEGGIDFIYVRLGDDPEPYGIATLDLVERPYPCCEVPAMLHGLACGWRQAAEPVNPVTEEQRDWKRMWDEANANRGERTVSVTVQFRSHAAAEVLQ